MTYEDIRRLNLNQLRPAMRVRLMKTVRWIDADGHVQKAPAAPSTSPFFFDLDQTTMIVASKTTSDLDDATAELLAATSVAGERANGELQVAVAGMRVQLFMPEALFSGLYTDAEPKMSYIDFRNRIYLQLAKQVQSRMTELLGMLGTLAAPAPQLDFTDLLHYARSLEHSVPAMGEQIGHVGLLGQQMADRGIMGLEIDVPLMVGLNPAALRLVRDAVWTALDESTAVRPLGDAIKATMQADGVQERELVWPVTTAVPVADNILPGFADQSRHVQLRLRNALLRGADVQIDLRSAGMFTIKIGDQVQHIVGRQTSLNDAAAVQVAQNVIARKVVLGGAKLPVPAGSRYTDIETAQYDYARSFQDKSIVIKGDLPETTSLFPIPATADTFTAAITRNLATTGAANVEMFVPGDQFSLLVLDGVVLGVSLRDFAYVVGDGRKSLTQLVDRRNRSRQLLGLPQIALNQVAPGDLTDQGVNADTIVRRGGQVYLGRNSQSATAGIWQDGRDMLDPSYDALAIDAAKALGLRLCAVSLVVPNGFVTYAADESSHGGSLATIVSVDPAPDLSEFERPTYGNGVSVLPEVIAAESK